MPGAVLGVGNTEVSVFTATGSTRNVNRWFPPSMRNARRAVLLGAWGHKEGPQPARWDSSLCRRGSQLSELMGKHGNCLVPNSLGGGNA